MKTKILMIALLMSCSVVVAAQTTEKGTRRQMVGREREMLRQRERPGPERGLNLTDAQKEAFKQSMLALQKQLQPVRNELAEAEVHQKTLVTAEKIDMAAINKNLEKIGALKVEIAKIQTKHRLDMRGQLTDEQRLRFDLSRNNTGGGRGQSGLMRGTVMPRKHRGK